MTVQTEPALLRSLIDYLTESADIAAERVAADRVAVSFVDACRPANEESELELRLSAWRPRRQTACARILRAA